MQVVLADKLHAAVRGGRSKGDLGPMSHSGSCSSLHCSKRVVTWLNDRGFCFEHFCSRCYELLERVESAAACCGPVNFVEALTELEECARRSLEISLSEAELNNLERARLLDILLWSGDLTTLLRRKRSGASQAAAAVCGGHKLQEALKSGQSD